MLRYDPIYYLIKKHTEIKIQEIGKIYDLDYSAVSQSCKRFEWGIKEDRKLARKVKQIENKLIYNCRMLRYDPILHSFYIKKDLPNY